MCLIIHKPAGVAIPADLLDAALPLNEDGFGVMGFHPRRGLLIHRQAQITLDGLLAFERAHRDAEYALHLRQRTRGDTEAHNLHPFTISGQLYLMHNGTIRLPLRVPGRSDTWHFVHDVLRPLAQRRPGVLLDNAFIQLLELALKPENKLALMDYAQHRIVLINREHGAELDGLWLSSTRWIDRGRLPLAAPPQAQERAYTAHDVQFI
jgi:hypothetical protein